MLSLKFCTSFAWDYNWRDYNALFVSNHSFHTSNIIVVKLNTLLSNYACFWVIRKTVNYAGDHSPLNIPLDMNQSLSEPSLPVIVPSVRILNTGWGIRDETRCIKALQIGFNKQIFLFWLTHWPSLQNDPTQFAFHFVLFYWNCRLSTMQLGFVPFSWIVRCKSLFTMRASKGLWVFSMQEFVCL